MLLPLLVGASPLVNPLVQAGADQLLSGSIGGCDPTVWCATTTPKPTDCLT